jgi:hypothetical protein
VASKNLYHGADCFSEAEVEACFNAAHPVAAQITGGSGLVWDLALAMKGGVELFLSVSIKRGGSKIFAKAVLS